MPTPRSGHAAVRVGTDLYAIGGTDRQTNALLASIDVYDTLGETWSSAPPMQIHREGHGAAEQGGLVYVFGGKEPSLLDDVEVFDPATGNWRFLMPLPSLGNFLAAQSIGGRIYVVGSFFTPHATPGLHIYDSVSDTWSPGPAVPPSQFPYASDVIGTDIYVVASRPRGGARLLMRLDTALDIWTVLAPKRRKLEDLGLAAHGGRLYAFGGAAWN